MNYSEMLKLSKTTFDDLNFVDNISIRLKDKLYLYLYNRCFCIYYLTEKLYCSKIYHEVIIFNDDNDYDEYFSDLVVFKELILPKYL